MSKGLYVAGAAALFGTFLSYLRKRNTVYEYNHSKIDGVVYPPFQTAERHEKICRALCGPRKGGLDVLRDVWVATYPKCGTTFMQAILLELTRHRSNLNGDVEEKGEKIDYHESPWPEAMLFREGKRGPKYMGVDFDELEACFRYGGAEAGERALRFLKTHARHEHLPGIYSRNGKAPKYCRAIVVTRNPKDACVSMFHHARNIPIFKYTGPFHDWVWRYARGDVESGCFWEWHAGWWQAKKKNPKQILWVTFENLKKEPAAEITRVARFLKLDASLSDAAFQELVAKTVKATTFKKMKAQYNSKHFRKGKSGGWRGVFTQKQSDAYDRIHGAKLSHVPDLRDSYVF
eukprot:g3687.t1